MIFIEDKNLKLRLIFPGHVDWVHWVVCAWVWRSHPFYKQGWRAEGLWIHATCLVFPLVPMWLCHGVAGLLVVGVGTCILLNLPQLISSITDNLGHCLFHSLVCIGTRHFSTCVIITSWSPITPAVHILHAGHLQHLSTQSHKKTSKMLF